MGIRHAFVSGKSDGGDATLVRPSDWNAAHDLSQLWTPPALKPATPTHDFLYGDSLSAFTAHSSGGSFAIGNCFVGGEDFIGSALDMQFSGQMGAIYKSHGNTDFDFTVGGIRKRGLTDTNMMFGVAGLDSSGNGVGVVVYNDSNIYFATISAWSYASFSDSWGNHGHNLTDGDWALRLKRISGTWTGYASQSMRAWDKTFGTRSDSITVDKIVFGLLYNSASTYNGRLIADYWQVDA